MAEIRTGAPLTYQLGTNDKSKRPPEYEPEVLPISITKAFIWAKEGPLGEHIVSGAGRNRLYGADTFDPRKKWANHVTPLVNAINAVGSVIGYERLRPTDAPDPSNVRLYLDLLETNVIEYERNPEDGSYKRDGMGQLIPTGNTIPGYRGKWVIAHIDAGPDGENLFGQGTILNGDQTDPATGKQSRRFPILDSEVSSFGAWGDDVGIRLWAPTTKTQFTPNDQLLTQEKVYPIRFAMMRRLDKNSSYRIVENNSAEQSMELVLKPGVIFNDINYSFEEVVIDSYQELSPNGDMPPKYAPVGRVHVYQELLEDILGDLYAAEQSYADKFSDFKGDPDEFWLFNVIGGTSSQGVPYHSFVLDSNGPDAVRLIETNTIPFTGGGDGTMTDAAFAKLVAERVREYGNPNSELQDLIRFPANYFYDTGFPLDVKKELCNFIALRKDTILFLTPFVAGAPVLTASQESSIAMSLRTRMQAFPESSYFNTPTSRGTVVGRCGKLLDKQYRGYFPLIIDFAMHVARFAGAGNGKFVSSEAFDQDGKNQVELFDPMSINVIFTPASVKHTDWSNGMIWVESYTRRKLFYPAAKTVYPDDSSVMTGLINVMITADLQVWLHRTRLFLSGNQKLTRGQRKERGEKFFIENTTGRYDDRAIIEAELYYTKADDARGYSYHMRAIQRSPNMVTVGQVYVEVYRRDDEQAN